MTVVPRRPRLAASATGPRQLLSDDLPADEELSEPTSFVWKPESEFAGHSELIELSRCGVLRRLRLGELQKEVEVHAQYADERPAVVSRRRGSRLFLLTTAPDPQWSDLGSGAGLLSWLHLLVDERSVRQMPSPTSAAGRAGPQLLSYAAGRRFDSRRTRSEKREARMDQVKEPGPGTVLADRQGRCIRGRAGRRPPGGGLHVNWPIEESVLRRSRRRNSSRHWE